MSVEPVHFEEPPAAFKACEAVIAQDEVPNKLPVIPEEALIIDVVIELFIKLLDPPLIINEPLIITLPNLDKVALPVHF